MALSPKEMELVGVKMNQLPIRYQEIYDEIADHMISGIETAKTNGDDRDVPVIFDEIITVQFEGKAGIQKLQLKQVMACNKQVRKMMWVNCKYYLNWKTTVTSIALIISGFYLPKTERIDAGLLFGLIIIAFAPSFYLLTRLKYKKAVKQSMARAFLTDRSKFLGIIVSILLFVPRSMALIFNINFLNPVHFHPAVYTVLLSFFIVYGLSTIRLIRYKFVVS